MNRFRKWNNALSGISKFLKKQGIKLHEYNMKGEIKIINQYSTKHNLKGSLSERILLISENFEQFKKEYNK